MCSVTKFDSINLGSKPLVSIIVPIYNSEKFLYDFLSCIQALTYKNYELIFVDDGSTDTSAKIIDDYCKNNSKAKVFHITNHGVSYARNLGVRESGADYVFFADCDDGFHPQILDILVKGILETNSDVAICNFSFEKESVLFYELRHEVYKKIKYMNIKGKEKNLQTFFSKCFSWGMPWNKLFRRDKLMTIKAYPNIFPEDSFVMEDCIMNFEYFLNVQSSVFINKKLYFYRFRKNSSRGNLNKHKVLTMTKCIDKIYNFNWLDPRTKKYANAFCGIHTFFFLRQILKTDFFDSILLDKYYKIYKIGIKNMILCSRFPFYLRFGMPLTIPYVYGKKHKRIKHKK